MPADVFVSALETVRNDRIIIDLSGLLDMENSHAHDRVRTVASAFAEGTKQGCPMHIYGAVVLRHGMSSHLVPIVLRLIGTPHMWSPLCTRAPQRENRTSPYGTLCPLPSLGVLPTPPSGFRISLMFEGTPVVKPGCARKNKYTSSREESGGGAPMSPRGKAREGKTYTL